MYEYKSKSAQPGNTVISDTYSHNFRVVLISTSVRKLQTLSKYLG